MKTEIIGKASKTWEKKVKLNNLTLNFWFAFEIDEDYIYILNEGREKYKFL